MLFLEHLPPQGELTARNDTLPVQSAPALHHLPPSKCWVVFTILPALLHLVTHRFSCWLELDGIPLRSPDSTCVDLPVVSLHDFHF